MVYRLQKSQPQVILVAHSRAFDPSIFLCRLIVGATGVRSLSMETREHLLLGRPLHPVPTLVVQTTSSSLHILGVSPYNQFTVSCSARAELEGETLHLYIFIMNWIVRKETPSSFASFSAVPFTRYRTTGSAEDGYLSIFNTTETDTVNTISYRCKATLVINNNIIINMISDTAVEVIGMQHKKNNCLSNQLSLLSSASPRSPFTPESVTVSAVSSTNATFGWTVPSIVYTPETYVVEYVTSQDGPDMISDPQYSGPNINIGSRNYSVQLNGLSAETLYQYQVVANYSK